MRRAALDEPCGFDQFPGGGESCGGGLGLPKLKIKFPVGFLEGDCPPGDGAARTDAGADR